MNRLKENSLVVVEGEGLGEKWNGSLGLADSVMYRMDKQQGPTV